MTRRSVEVAGERWWVYPSGRISFYDRDEVGLVFEKGAGRNRKRRVTRFRPTGDPRRDVALTQLTEPELLALFHQSQPSWTSPEVNYNRRSD
ncbi:MAG: hypothetical protein V3R24_02930 [Gemmatimonadales bacterium]